MKFSICSWTFGDAPIDEVMRFVAETGYDAIEIRAAVDKYNWQEIKSLSESLSLEIGGLTGDTGWPNEEQDLANKNPENRKKAVQYFKRQIEAAHEVGGKYLVVCPSAVGKAAPMGEPGEDWQWAVESVRQLTGLASELDITLVIEPLNRYESCIVNNSEDALRFVQELQHPKVKTLLDTYHMNIEDQYMDTPFKELVNHLEIIHVADSNRQALGRGHINFDEVISGIKSSGFDRTIVVECTAPGPNPFQADKGDSMEYIYTYAKESLDFLKQAFK